MARTSPIDLLAGRTPPPPQWSAAWVLARVIEIYTVERRMPRPIRNGSSSAWLFPVKHEFSEIVGWDDARERVWEAWARASGVMPWEITRADEAAGWVHEFLAGHPGEKRCLQVYALCRAYGRPTMRECRKRGWPRATFGRKVASAAKRIAIGLNARGVPVR